LRLVGKVGIEREGLRAERLRIRDRRPRASADAR
jgi:hypothetical protein